MSTMPGFLQSIRPMVKKELRQIRRDPTSLAMLLVLPAALIVIVGYALNFDVKHVPLVIFDESRTSASREYLDKFRHTENFDVVGEVSSYREIEDFFLFGKGKVAIIIPSDFSRDVLAGRGSPVQILVDGSDANTAGQAMNNAVRTTMQYSTDLAVSAAAFKGRAVYQPIDLKPRVWYNPDLRSSEFLIPGLIGFIIVLTAVISTSMTVVREKERGTMEQIMVSPLRPVQVILGKTIPYLFVGLVAATAILVIGYFLFGISIKGSILLLYTAILFVTLGALGQGLLISTVTDSQQVAFMVSVFSSLLPSMLLSGFVFPVASMPIPLQVLSNIAINKFFLIVVRGVMLKGAGMFDVWPQFAAMTVFATLTLGISVKRMQKRSL
jgi:ABC-2 type transport system permease protein